MVRLGDGCDAEASFTLWYVGSAGAEVAFASGELRVAEFSFAFDRKGGCTPDSIDTAAKNLLAALSDPRWVAPGGKTKTAVAYGD